MENIKYSFFSDMLDNQGSHTHQVSALLKFSAKNTRRTAYSKKRKRYMVVRKHQTATQKVKASKSWKRIYKVEHWYNRKFNKKNISSELNIQVGNVLDHHFVPQNNLLLPKDITHRSVMTNRSGSLNKQRQTIFSER